PMTTRPSTLIALRLAIRVLPTTTSLFVVGFALTVFAAPSGLLAQQPDGPQQNSPTPAAPPAPGTQPAPLAPSTVSSEKVMVPAGTRLGVMLENGISTRSAKPGDSVYLRTTFPITENNQIVIPIGSYLRGEILESKRPGRIKGKGSLRMKLNTLIFPNGYTV